MLVERLSEDFGGVHTIFGTESGAILESAACAEQLIRRLEDCLCARLEGCSCSGLLCELEF